MKSTFFFTKIPKTPLSKEQQQFYQKISAINKEYSLSKKQRFRARLLTLLFYLIILPSFLSYRKRFTFADKTSETVFRSSQPSVIFTYWHEYDIVLIPFFIKFCIWRNMRVCPLVSPSTDGQILTRILQNLGVTPIRGSSGKQAVQMLRNIKSALNLGSHIVITPDGPRGPKGTVKEGLAFMSQLSGAPIVPIHFVSGDGQTADKRWWRLSKSWDQTIIPRPFSRLEFRIGPMILSRKDMNRSNFSKYIENTMNQHYQK